MRNRLYTLQGVRFLRTLAVVLLLFVMAGNAFADGKIPYGKIPPAVQAGIMPAVGEYDSGKKYAAASEDGISLGVNISDLGFAEDDFFGYSGIYLDENQECLWSWGMPEEATVGDGTTVLTYGAGGYFYFQFTGSPYLSAVKLYLDPSEEVDMNLDLVAGYADFNEGSLYLVDADLTVDAEQHAIYWLARNGTAYDNVYFMLNGGSLSIIGFELYSPGLVPDNFLSGGDAPGEGSVKAPVFSPASCSFYNPMTVSISAEDGCDIYYALGSETPEIAEENRYVAPFLISTTTDVCAVAVDDAGNESRPAFATYTCTKHGIGEGYNPPSPPDPSAPDTVRMHILYVVPNPAEAGTNMVYEVVEGTVCEIQASGNSGWIFRNWTINGEVVSEESSLLYAMPGEDVVLTANYTYAPGSPADPQTPAVTHPVTLRSIPSGVCSFSPGTYFPLAEGEQLYCYAYPENGFAFVKWYVNGIEQPDNWAGLSVTMGSEPLDIVALCEYSPSSPANPGANYYEPYTGKMIIDDFEPGGMYSMARALTGGDCSNVNSLIVKGVMNSYDLGAISWFSNAETIDLSRTSGVPDIPGYAFSGLSAATISLPSTVASIGSYAFSGSYNLASLICYAVEPPSCSGTTFSESGFENEGCTVYVPAGSVELYKAAEYWKDFIIMPITDNVHVLQVNLPEDCADGRYKDNSLELVNVSTGVRQKYVVSDRLLYTFSNLQEDEQYNVYMLSQAGLEIGRIEGIVIPDEDISVTFDALKQLYEVKAKVVSPDGAELTDDVTTEWLKPLADGTLEYLRKGVSLGNVPEGQELVCRVTLGAVASVMYSNPADVRMTVGDGAEDFTVTLSPLRAITLTGTVTDEDGSGMADAAVSLTQTFNGRYDKSYVSRTDRQGRWTATVLDAPETLLTYAAAECVNVNDSIGAFDQSADSFDLGAVTLRRIDGARIAYGFTYRAAGTPESEIENFYDDYANVAVSVYNVTQDRPHQEISQQYPEVVILDENVNPGDELRLTATSKTGAFNPVERTVKVDEDLRSEVTFPIVGKGGIYASFEMAQNPAVTGMLYDAGGELIKKGTYAEASLTFTALEDGDYTLVSMGRSDLMNSVLRLSGFEEIGLAEGRDYVKNVVTVKSGELTVVEIAEIPAFDESLFYYTNSSASFTSNNSSIVTGNYITLRSSADFKSVYKSGISDVALVVDLPAGCEFVEGSVIQGVNLLSYTFENGRLTVPLGDNYRSQVRFCVVPTRGGEFKATGSVSFDYGGRKVMQPIGTATVAVKEIEISVPRVIAGKEFAVTGVAKAASKVSVYFDGVIAASTTANGNGAWLAEWELSDLYNLSEHSVYAEIETEEGLKLMTETENVLYDENAIQVSKVIMYHWNPEMGTTYESVFDFLNPSLAANKWTVYYPDKKFTYTIEFTDRSADRISNVVLYVHTADGKYLPYEAHYDSGKKLWIVECDLGSSPDNYPVNVSVDFDCIYENIILDSDLFSDSYDEIPNLQEDLANDLEDINVLYSSVKEYRELESFDFSEFLSLCNEYLQLIGMDKLSLEDIQEMTEFSENEIEVLQSSYESFMTEYGMESINNFLDVSFKQIESNVDAEGLLGSIKVSTCESISIDETYFEITTSDGYNIYVKTTEKGIVIVDIQNNVCYEIAETVSTFNSPLCSENTIDGIRNFINQLDEKTAKARDIISEIFGILDEVDTHLEGGMKYCSENCSEAYLRLASLQRAKAAGKEVNKMQMLVLELIVDGYNDTFVSLKKAREILSQFNSKFYSKVFGVLGLIGSFMDCKKDLERYISFYYSVPNPCTNDQENADAIRTSIVTAGISASLYYIGNISADVISLLGIGPAVTAAPATGGSSLGVAFAAVGKLAMSTGFNMFCKWLNDKFFVETEKRIQSLDCQECGDEPCPTPDLDGDSDGNKDNDGDNDDTGGPYKSGQPNDQVLIDPSGYVYEAVPSNRVEGVQASLYYKETKEDMYGDPYEEVVLWDAENYAQENPLFTDENGKYRWDVPQGMWQVKFEKDGYLTTYSDWLPVPPPQLEVNIPITQNRQPEVTEAHAYEEGVEVQFDKFMDETTLTTDNIYVTAGGEKVSGDIVLTDSQVSDPFVTEDEAADALHYTSRVRFVPEVPLSMSIGEVRLTVSRNVLSYAGIPMTETFTQTFDIEKEVREIVADDVKVLYGGEKEITVYAVPFDAAVGRTLHVENSADIIASVDTTDVVLDDEGKAVITVTGELPGTARLTFSIDDVAVTGEADIDVVTEIITPEKPKASRASGTAVYRGTAIELSTDTEGGTIYFTTDGSCPCDENGTRRKYTVPVVINDDTEILAITVTGDSEEDMSETARFEYILKRSDMDFIMNEGWTWISHNFETPLSPEELAQDGNIESILGRDSEVVNDPEFGLIGRLTELEPTESYKVKSKAETSRIHLADVAWNPATPIAVETGWNWLGYPVGQTMTLTEAFVPTDAEELDCVVGQEGFAQFDGESWVGTLQTLVPGAGYMYRSVSDKEIVYNTSIVSNAAALHADGILSDAVAAVDKYRYPQIMCVVAELYDLNGFKADAEDYSVLAFSGTECRGVGKVIDGMVMMSVYGNSGDDIMFRIVDENGNMIDVAKHETFGESMLGDINVPYVMMLDGKSVKDADLSGGIRVFVAYKRLCMEGISPDLVKSVSIYNVNGAKCMSVKGFNEAGIPVDGLPDGIYVIEVECDGASFSYHKIQIG